jgi:single-stranded-DNA-specific exonuclease
MPEETILKKEFWEEIKKVSAQLKEEEDFLVVSHHDADGMTACAIMVDALRSLGKYADFMILKQLDSNTIQKVVDRKAKTVVFTDMGSGQLKLLKESGIKNFYIIDHHAPEAPYEKQLNPHFHGYNGGLDISASGMAYLTAKALGNSRMAHLAIVGAVGDMQDSDGKLHSLNRVILQEGIDQGLIKVKNDLRLFGRQSRPLTMMLVFASEPVLPGLTGDEKACVAFLENLGIELRTNERLKTYVDLDIHERRALTSALYMLLVDANIPEFIIQSMIGEVFSLPKEQKHTELRDGKEYASVLNACGRQGEADVGVTVCLGDRETNWETAKLILRRHRDELKEGIMFLKQEGVKERKNFYFFDAGGAIGENIIGVIAGMAYGARVVPPNKPILAFADDRDDLGFVKISGRANWALIRRGLHLGNALREESARLGGEGGGHDIAAGARIPKSKREEFLENIDQKIGQQLKK